MIKATFRVPQPLRTEVSAKRLQVELDDGSTLADALKVLESMADEALMENGKLSDSYTLFLNGESVSRSEVGEKEVHDGDEVILFVPFSGG